MLAEYKMQNKCMAHISEFNVTFLSGIAVLMAAYNCLLVT